MFSVHSIDITEGVTATTEGAYTGISVTIPAGAYCCITATAVFSNSPAKWVGICTGANNNISQCYSNALAGKNHASCTYSFYASAETPIHIWASWVDADVRCDISVRGFYILPN